MKRDTIDSLISALALNGRVRLSNGKADPTVGELWAERTHDGRKVRFVRIRRDGFKVVEVRDF